jgi:hypothetical protein
MEYYACRHVVEARGSEGEKGRLLLHSMKELCLRSQKALRDYD